jgi:hypothetical protein
VHVGQAYEYLEYVLSLNLCDARLTGAYIMVAKLLVLLFERDKAVRHANLATVIVSHAYGNLTHTTMGAAMKILKTQYIDQES